jgi:V8-like Glu-specific endopeptidase
MTISAAFMALRRFDATVPAQPKPAGTTVSGSAIKPAAAPTAIPEASTRAAAGDPTAPSPGNLTDEELFRLKAPSVVLLQVFNQSGQMTGTGSGFLAGPDRTVITNYHMIRGAYSERAVFQDGSSADVLGVLGYSSADDLAAIRLNASPAKPLELGDSDSVEVGDRVVAIGSPHGLQNTISDGLVSAFRSGRIQTSTPISPGSSGGPFFNQRGEVIGVAVSGLRDAQNLNFVVPIDLAKHYLEDSTLTTLPDLIAQNTVVSPLGTSTISIAAGKTLEWPFEIDERMENAELRGAFRSSGGVGGRIQVFIEDRATNQRLYGTERVEAGQFDLKLRPGAYRLVFDNTGSQIFPRTVDVAFAVRFVK